MVESGLERGPHRLVRRSTEGASLVRILPTRALRQELVDVDGRFLRWCGEAARDALLHAGHQDAVAKALPALLGVVDRHDRPASGRWTGRVEDLAFGHAAGARVHGGDRRLVLLSGAAGEMMHDP